MGQLTLKGSELVIRARRTLEALEVMIGLTIGELAGDSVGDGVHVGVDSPCWGG